MLSTVSGCLTRAPLPCVFEFIYRMCVLALRATIFLSQDISGPTRQVNLHESQTRVALYLWHALLATSKYCTRTVCDVSLAVAVAFTTYLGDQCNEHMYTYKQEVNSMPSNSVILYGLIG